MLRDELNVGAVDVIDWCARHSVLNSTRLCTGSRRSWRYFCQTSAWRLSATAWGLAANTQITTIINMTMNCLQCFDAVGWAAGRASGL